MGTNLLRAHGTVWLYRHGCSCALCRAANAGRARAWIAEHREEEAARSRRNYERDKGKCLMRMKRWRDSNQEKVKELRRAYQAGHREDILARVRTQKARKRAAPGSHTAADVAAQYKRQRGRCFWGSSINPSCTVSLDGGYHVDHIVPLSLGGGNGPENLVLACPSCNLRKGGKHPMDFGMVLF